MQICLSPGREAENLFGVALYYGVRTQHAETMGSRGMPPTRNFLKIGTKRLNLVAFQSINNNFLGKLKTR